MNNEQLLSISTTALVSPYKDIYFWYLLNVSPIIDDGLVAVASQTLQTRERERDR